MPDQTQIIPPRVPFIDARTGFIAREWYLFLLSLFGDSTNLQAAVQALQVELATLPGDDASVARQAAEARLLAEFNDDTGALERDVRAVQQQVATQLEDDADDARRLARDAYLLGMLT